MKKGLAAILCLVLNLSGLAQTNLNNNHTTVGTKADDMIKFITNDSLIFRNDENGNITLNHFYKDTVTTGSTPELVIGANGVTPPIGLNNKLQNNLANSLSIIESKDGSSTIVNSHSEDYNPFISYKDTNCFIFGSYCNDNSLLSGASKRDTIICCSATNGSGLILNGTNNGAIYSSVNNAFSGGFSNSDISCRFYECYSNSSSYLSHNNRNCVIYSSSCDDSSNVMQFNNGVTIAGSYAGTGSSLSNSLTGGSIKNCVSQNGGVLSFNSQGSSLIGCSELGGGFGAGQVYEVDKQNLSTTIEYCTSIGGTIATLDTSCTILNSDAFCGGTVSNGQKGAVIENSIVIGSDALGNCTNCYTWGNGSGSIKGTDGAYKIEGMIHATSDDVYIESIGRGVIMKSPDGNCWRITPTNGTGALISTKITCP